MAGPLRTLHVDTELSWRGGEQQALYLARGLAARGHRAEVAAASGSELARRAREAGLDVFEVVARGELAPRAILSLAGRLKRGAFDLVHAHTSHAHTLAAIAARLAGVPVVVSRRVDFRRRRSPFSAWKYRRLGDRFVAISAAVRDVLVADGVAPGRISVVPSGIDPRRLEGADGARARRSLGLEDEPLVGSVAHFAAHKGLDVLIAAAPAVLARFPRARFLLAGDGECAADLKAQAAPLRDAVLFPGFRADVPDLLAACDVVACPSRMEGLNTTNLDALCLARPLVASRAGGIPEAVVDGETGLLVPPEDPAALAAAIVRLLADRALAEKLGAAGRARVLERFTVDAMVEGTLAVYRGVVAP